MQRRLIVLKVDQKLRVGSHEAKQWVKHENLLPVVFCFPPLKHIEVKKEFSEAGRRPCHKWRLARWSRLARALVPFGRDTKAARIANYEESTR